MQSTEKLKHTAHKYILNGLLSGKYKSGKYLNIDELSQSLGMSKTPIREALVELESENLVSRDGRYYYVFSLSSKDVVDLYELKRMLEGEAAFLATGRVTPDVLGRMEETINKIDDLLKTSDPDPVILADLSADFHSKVAVATGNKYLVKHVEDIRLKLKIVRVTLFTVFNRRIEDLEEHRAVFEAIKKGDPENARTLMFKHQDKVSKFVEDNLLMQFY